MNTLEYAAIFQPELDTQTIAGATSGWMEDNAGQVKYSGGSDVKIPRIDMDGLADYDRNEGYKKGSVSLAFETKTMTMDRARTFLLDAMDVDETNFAVAAGNVMGEFQKQYVIPEIDAYRYSKIAALAMEAGNETIYTPSANDILTKLQADIYEIWDKAGEGVGLIITMSMRAAAILSSSKEISKKLDVSDFKQGEISTKVTTLDGMPIIKVPSARLYSEYLFKTGGSGQEKGGFQKTTDAKAINWIICARTAPIAVSKTDNMRIFDPQTTQEANAWKIDYRKYHDLWVKKNQLQTVRVNYQ